MFRFGVRLRFILLVDTCRRFQRSVALILGLAFDFVEDHALALRSCLSTRQIFAERGGGGVYPV
jgi:hypothetical protein